jgi:hypothetical protein
MISLPHCFRVYGKAVQHGESMWQRKPIHVRARNEKIPGSPNLLGGKVSNDLKPPLGILSLVSTAS